MTNKLKVKIGGKEFDLKTATQIIVREYMGAGKYRHILSLGTVLSGKETEATVRKAVAEAEKKLINKSEIAREK